MRWKTEEFRKKHMIREESYQKIRELIQASPPTAYCFLQWKQGTCLIRLKTDFEKFLLRPLTGGNFHVKVKAVIRLTEVEMTTGSIA